MHWYQRAAAIVAASFVLLTLFFLTPLLYHLPKPALAAMIIVAVANLIDLRAISRAWAASRDDGVAALLTFVATLAFAPNIQNGILTGIIFALGAFIYRRMSPRIVEVGMHSDGTLRDVRHFKLPPLHRQIGAIRCDAALFFANVSFFEEAIRKLERDNPDLKIILVAAGSINQIDASGVEMLRELVLRLRECGITIVVSGAKRQFMEVIRRTGLDDIIGQENFFTSDALAVASLLGRLPAKRQN